MSKLRTAGVISAHSWILRQGQADPRGAVIGKANMEEFAGWKGLNVSDGWSAVGGQCSSAYVEGGFKAGGNPGGSSSGSAVGVSAGFAVASLGTDMAQS